MDTVIRNKVAESGIITLNLEDYYPKETLMVFDLKPFLFMEMILKEKDFREALKSLDWSAYKDRMVAVTCTADAIIPMWAYMLVVSYLQPVSSFVAVGTPEIVKQQILMKNLAAIDVHQFDEKRVVLKGCGELPVGEAAYAEVTRLLLPVVKSIMYGEPCSTVPVFKRR